MPIVFIHGVNVRREDASYTPDLTARDDLLRRRVLDPLAARDPRFSAMQIVSPYWGGDGVTFAWGQATLPPVRLMEALGAEPGSAATAADLEVAQVVRDLAPLEPLGAAASPLKTAALADPTRFVEALLAPMRWKEVSLAAGPDDTPEQFGHNLAMLAEAGRDVARDPAALADVAAAGTDAQVIARLEARIQDRVAELAAAAPPPGPGGDAAGRLEDLGPGGGMAGFVAGLKARVGEVFDRALGAPGRVASVAALDLARGDLHRNITRFLGDVFVYLDRRDAPGGGPGPIVNDVLDPIRAAVARGAPGEPLVVITHSMGGNIVYDLLTHYASDLRVDFWTSVASQVGQFEEMKLFKASNPATRTPATVGGLKPRLGHWINVYDPADVLSFLARPVFSDVDEDIEYRTGANTFQSHGAYFQRASFYDLVFDRLSRSVVWH